MFSVFPHTVLDMEGLEGATSSCRMCKQSSYGGPSTAAFPVIAGPSVLQPLFTLKFHQGNVRRRQLHLASKQASK